MNLEGKQQIWKDYQKEIADDHYFYARSCIRQTFFPGSEWAYLDIMKNKLGKDVIDDPRHTTCTGIGYHSDIVPVETIMTVVARHFALMTEAGYENMTPSCITSFGIYTEILETWHHHPEVEEKIREYLWKATKREFKKPKNLAHTSDIIYKFRNEIAAQACLLVASLSCLCCYGRRSHGKTSPGSGTHRVSLLENVPHERNWWSRISGRIIRYDLCLGRRCD